MAPKTLLDTDILSALMRKDPIVVDRARRYLAEQGQLTISLITRYEILRGLKARNAVKQLARFDEFCASNEVLPITDDIIVRASGIYADLRQKGQLIPDADILIAATAIQHGLALSTNNVGHLGRIPALVIDNWQL